MPCAPKALPPVRLAPAGDGGDDGERVSGGNAGGLFCGQVANVFVVQVEVNKGAQFSLGGEEVLAQLGVGPGERSESFGDGCRLDFDGGWPPAKGRRGVGMKIVMGKTPGRLVPRSLFR